jgi:hypothetical protein
LSTYSHSVQASDSRVVLQQLHSYFLRAPRCVCGSRVPVCGHHGDNDGDSSWDRECEVAVRHDGCRGGVTVYRDKNSEEEGGGRVFCQ